MNDLLDYLPGTADNLLFLTLAVLVLLMITGIYGYLNVDTHRSTTEAKQRNWGWPVLSLFALAVLFFWFGQPLKQATETGSPLYSWFVLLSQFVTGFLVIGFGAAAVFASDLKTALTSAAISFLTSGLLLLQAELLPLMLLCWLMLGTMVWLFLYRGSQVSFVDSEEAGPFREPFLACLVCGFLLCSILWVVHREWGPGAKQVTARTETATQPDDLAIVQQFLNEHWTTLILLQVFVLVAFVGMTRLKAAPGEASFTDSIEGSMSP